MRASPSPIPNFFRYQKTSETKKDSSTEVFGTVRQKSLTENFDKTILSKKNSLSETSDTLKISSTIFAATVRGKLLKKICDTTSLSPAPPPPNLIQKVSLHQKFCETQKSSPTMFFGTVIKRIFIENRVFPHLFKKIFDTRNYSHSKGFPNGVFQHNETKNSWRIIVIIAPPSNPWFLSIPENSWNTKRLPYEVFSYSQTTNFREKIVMFSSYA